MDALWEGMRAMVNRGQRRHCKEKLINCGDSEVRQRTGKLTDMDFFILFILVLFRRDPAAVDVYLMVSVLPIVCCCSELCVSFTLSASEVLMSLQLTQGVQTYHSNAWTSFFLIVAVLALGTVLL